MAYTEVTPLHRTSSVGGEVRRVRTLGRFVRGPFAVAALVLLLNAAFVVSIVRTTGVYTFTDQGSTFVERGHTDPAIRMIPGQEHTGAGYDGQFFYYIALDPFTAAPYIDAPAYRFARIAYPILARALAFGVQAAIPWTLVAINVAANTLGTLALAVWLRRRSFSPWLAAIFGLAPGMVAALQYDLSDSMAYALCAGGVLALDLPRPWLRAVVAGLAFSVAALTRETTIIYGLVFAAWILLQRREWPSIRSQAGPALLVGLLTIVPYLVWRQLVEHWFPGTMPPFTLPVFQNNQTPLFEVIPYYGLVRWFVLPQVDTGVPIGTFAVAIPGTIFGVWVARVLWQARGRFVYGWLYLVNALVGVVFLQRYSYVDPIANTRTQDAVILAAVLCIPFLYRQARARTISMVSGCSALWMSVTPLWLLVPIGVYLHTALHHRLIP